jgi:hypothetical protein
MLTRPFEDLLHEASVAATSETFGKPLRQKKVGVVLITVAIALLGALSTVWYDMNRNINPWIEKSSPIFAHELNEVPIAIIAWGTYNADTDLEISSGTTVKLPIDLDVLQVRNVFVHGKLQCPDDANFKLTFSMFSMVIDKGGEFICGTSNQTFLGDLQLNVRFVHPDEIVSL